jgi:hypothetical protein
MDIVPGRFIRYITPINCLVLTKGQDRVLSHKFSRPYELFSQPIYKIGYYEQYMECYNAWKAGSILPVSQRTVLEEELKAFRNDHNLLNIQLNQLRSEKTALEDTKVELIKLKEKQEVEKEKNARLSQEQLLCRTAIMQALKPFATPPQEQTENDSLGKDCLNLCSKFVEIQEENTQLKEKLIARKSSSTDHPLAIFQSVKDPSGFIPFRKVGDDPKPLIRRVVIPLSNSPQATVKSSAHRSSSKELGSPSATSGTGFVLMPDQDHHMSRNPLDKRLSVPASLHTKRPKRPSTPTTMEPTSKREQLSNSPTLNASGSLVEVLKAEKTSAEASVEAAKQRVKQSAKKLSEKRRATRISPKNAIDLMCSDSD